MLSTLRDRGEVIIDVHRQPQEEYAEHCRQADIIVRHCVTVCRTTTGTATLSPEAWPITAVAAGTRFRRAAQDTLEPYFFGPATYD